MAGHLCRAHPCQICAQAREDLKQAERAIMSIQQWWHYQAGHWEAADDMGGPGDDWPPKEWSAVGAHSRPQAVSSE